MKYVFSEKSGKDKFDTLSDEYVEIDTPKEYMKKGTKKNEQNPINEVGKETVRED
jgi:hypothetical protein